MGKGKRVQGQKSPKQDRKEKKNGDGEGE